MKSIIKIQPISSYTNYGIRKERLEIEYYEDGTKSIVVAIYYRK